MLDTLKEILTAEAERGGQSDFNYPIVYSLVSIALDKGQFARDRLAAIKMLMPYLERMNAEESVPQAGEQLEMDFDQLDKVMIRKAMEGDTAAYNALVRKASTLEDEDENDYQVVKRLVITPVDMSKPKDDGTTEEED